MDQDLTNEMPVYMSEAIEDGWNIFHLILKYLI